MLKCLTQKAMATKMTKVMAIALFFFGLTVSEARAQTNIEPVYQGAVIESSWLANVNHAKRYFDITCERDVSDYYEDTFSEDSEFAALDYEDDFYFAEALTHCGWVSMWLDTLLKNSDGPEGGYTEDAPFNFMYGHQVSFEERFSVAATMSYSYLQIGDHRNAVGDGHRMNFSIGTGYRQSDYAAQGGLRMDIAGDIGFSHYHIGRIGGNNTHYLSSPEVLHYGGHARISYILKKGNYAFEPSFSSEIINVSSRKAGETRTSGTETNALSPSNITHLFANGTADVKLSYRREDKHGWIDSFLRFGMTALYTSDDINIRSGVSGNVTTVVNYRHEVNNLFFVYDAGFNWKVNDFFVLRFGYEGMASPDGVTVRHGGKFRVSY